MEFYGSLEALHEAFEAFVENIPFYGFAVLCIDHPAVQSLIGRIQDRRIVTYGTSSQADVRLGQVTVEEGQSRFDVIITKRKTGEERNITGLTLPMLGQHNVTNALAAVAVAEELGVSEPQIRQALANFAGVKRRFTMTGVVRGITIIDDYGHHPVEITAVLQAARQSTGQRVIAVVQPHRYTRLSDLFEDFCACFNDADEVIVAEVYSAGEAPIEGADRDSLVEGLRSRGHRNVKPLAAPEDLAAMIKEDAADGDLVVCLGAGSISAWANDLPDELEALFAADDPINAGAGL